MKIPHETQTEWASWKYYVMSRSQADYNFLRQLFSDNYWDEEKEAVFRETLATVKTTEPTVGSLRNAYQHVWGYFKRIASPPERETYQMLLENLDVTNDQLGPFLKQLALTYDSVYLKASHLLFP